MTAWYYGDGALEAGPVDDAALADLVRTGAITGQSRLRAEAAAEWGLAADVFPDLFAAPARGWTETKPHPWRRYAARFVDNMIVGGVTWFMIGLVFGLVAPGVIEAFTAQLAGPYGNLLNGMMTLAVALPGNALITGLTGLSIGKWIFGVRVLRNGRPIGFPAAISREFEVWWRGLAGGVPLVSLGTLWHQFDRLSIKTPSTPWDMRQGNVVTYRPETLASKVWMWVAVAVVVGASILLRLATRK